jgi:hypothetical protein
MRVKGPGRGFDRRPPSVAEVKEYSQREGTAIRLLLFWALMTYSRVNLSLPYFMFSWGLVVRNYPHFIFVRLSVCLNVLVPVSLYT